MKVCMKIISIFIHSLTLGIILVHPVERRRQNILYSLHIPMSVEELLARLLDSDMNIHTGHLGMVEVRSQQPIMNSSRSFM